MAAFLLVVSISFERWRGESALANWKRLHTGRGEQFDASAYPISFEAVAFSNDLQHAVRALPRALDKFAGHLAGMAEHENGGWVRGSQQERPRRGQKLAPFTWAELHDVLVEAQPALETLRRLVMNPPPGSPIDLGGLLESDFFPNWGAMRRSAQALHLTALHELHRGDVDGAVENIEALFGAARIYREDKMMDGFLLRMAILGLAQDALWDALCDERLTIDHLRRLQMLCRPEEVFAQIPGLMESERITRLHTWHRFKEGSYEEWMFLSGETYRSFGVPPPARDVAPSVLLWREYVFHPVWSVAWSAQEELEYLRFSQFELELVRRSVARRSYASLRDALAEMRDGRAQWDKWRFHNRIPLQNGLFEFARFLPPAVSDCPYPDHTPIWLAAVKKLTLAQMASTAIALRRHLLEYGSYPEQLTELVPAFMGELPCDFMDGGILRYRRLSEGQFVLYSAGENGSDDNGNFSRDRGADMFSAPDWPWPQSAIGARQ